MQLIIPQAHMVFERDSVVPQAQALFKKGAVAVFNLMRQPGNEMARDFSNCGGPCVNIGGHDGFFLENVIEKAAAAKLSDKLRAQITLKTQTFKGLKAENAVAVIPGSASDEVIVLNAHYDGWFEGAGDNGDGLSVLMALARHFAKPENKPRRTLALVSSAGHHSPGINGPRGFVAANPALAAKAIIMVNLEHVAQRNFNPSRNVASNGYREAIADSGEAPITPGITNGSPFLNTLFDQGVQRYGVNFVSDASRDAERRDRRLRVDQGRQADDHAGAAAVSHHRRSARRDLDPRPRTHRALLRLLREGSRQGAGVADQPVRGVIIRVRTTTGNTKARRNEETRR